MSEMSPNVAFFGNSLPVPPNQSRQRGNPVPPLDGGRPEPALSTAEGMGVKIHSHTPSQAPTSVVVQLPSSWKSPFRPWRSNAVPVSSPSVDAVLANTQIAQLLAVYRRDWVVGLVRQELDQARRSVREGQDAPSVETVPPLSLLPSGTCWHRLPAGHQRHRRGNSHQPGPGAPQRPGHQGRRLGLPGLLRPGT